MVPYFEGSHFLTPLALGMVPFLVIFFFVKKTGPNRAFIGLLARGRAGPGRFENVFYCRPRVLLFVNSNLRLQQNPGGEFFNIFEN